MVAGFSVGEYRGEVKAKGGACACILRNAAACLGNLLSTVSQNTCEKKMEYT